jgi:hypothetical protein
MTRGSADAAQERYYQGRIKRLFRGSETGIVRSATGREIPFEFQHVVMYGPVRDFDGLREGLAVGFDVGWTSHGLRVTALRVVVRDPSKREAGAEEEIASDELADGDTEDGDVE